MERVEIKSRVGSDGVLHIDFPMANDANREVKVIIEPIPTPEEWAQRILANAGTWQGDFVRPDQGVLEERDPMS